MKYFYIITLIVWGFLSPKLLAQHTEIELSDLEQITQKQPQKSIIFLKTDWCYFCEKMAQNFIKNKALQTEINQHFYLVKFNVSEKKSIIWQNKIYENKFGLHELAFKLGQQDQQMIYPTLIILNEKQEILSRYSGYINPEKLIQILESLNE